MIFINKESFSISIIFTMADFLLSIIFINTIAFSITNFDSLLVTIITLSTTTFSLGDFRDISLINIFNLIPI